MILVNHAHYLENNLGAFRQELLQLPQISHVSASCDVPGNNLINWGFGAQDVDESFSLNVNLTDEHYLETMGMELVAGRYFSEEFGHDTGKIILNETALELLGYEDPIGKNIFLWAEGDRPLEVIGVVRDYFYESKHRLIRPHALMHHGYMEWTVPAYISVRVKRTDLEKTIHTLEEGWNRYVASIPFDYEFLDEHYEGIYHNEKQTRTLLYIFAYRVDIRWWIFLVAGVMAFIIAMATVSFHALKASRQNPGVSLRYE